MTGFCPGQKTYSCARLGTAKRVLSKWVCLFLRVRLFGGLKGNQKEAGRCCWEVCGANSNKQLCAKRELGCSGKPMFKSISQP